jgi:hypothetical protein
MDAIGLELHDIVKTGTSQVDGIDRDVAKVRLLLSMCEGNPATGEPT